MTMLPLTHLFQIVLRRAETYPTDVAIGGQEGLTWRTLDSRELLEGTNQLADELAGEGIRAGDRVVVWLPSGWRTPVYLFALWKLGAVVVPFDREMNPEAAARIIRRVDPRCVLVGYNERPAWTSHARVLEWWTPGRPTTVASETSRRGAPGTRSAEPASDEPGHIPDEPLAAISFTSGTTGEPKGCMITHANFCAQIASAFDLLPLDTHCRIASILPLSHLFELTGGLLYPLAAGAAVHYVPSRRGPDLVRVLNEQHITHMLVVPQILASMGQAADEQLEQRVPPPLRHTLETIADHLPIGARRYLYWMVHRHLGGKLRLFVAGGAALPPHVHRLWERFGVRVLEGYGASECSPMIACAAVDGSTPIGSVGQPLSGVQVRLADDGEVLVRGPNVMRGYWADPVRSAAVLSSDGWYRTGDLATIDRAGNIRLVGRAKDLIVLPSGMKVWPEDVEAVLREHPAVKDAAVVAVPMPSGGASLHAYIVPTTQRDTRVEVRQIIVQCNARLAQHQRIASGSWWPEADFPRTPMLKLRRHLLPRPAAVAAIRVASALAADDPVSQAIAGAAHVASVSPDQTLGDLGLDSLGLVELAEALEEKTGRPVGDADLRLAMTVAQVHDLFQTDALPIATPTDNVETVTLDIPLWPYTRGRAFRCLGVLVDAIYAAGVTHTFVLGGEHLLDLPSPVIFAGTHHGFADMPLVHHALVTPASRRQRRPVVTAIAAGGFNSGGPRLGSGLGLIPWYGILGLGLYPLRQRGGREASLRRLVRVAQAGNDILIFPQGTHVRPDDERAGDPAATFHTGVAHLAEALAADIVPFGLAGTELVMPPDPSVFEGRLIAGIPVAVHRGPLAIAFGQRLRLLPHETPESFTLRLQTVCFALTRDAEQALTAQRDQAERSAGPPRDRAEMV